MLLEFLETSRCFRKHDTLAKILSNLRDVTGFAGIPTKWGKGKVCSWKLHIPIVLTSALAFACGQASGPSPNGSPSGPDPSIDEYAEYNCSRDSFETWLQPYAGTWGAVLPLAEAQLARLERYDGPLSDPLEKHIHSPWIAAVRESVDEIRKKDPTESFDEAQWEAFQVSLNLEQPSGEYAYLGEQFQEACQEVTIRWQGAGG